MQDDTVKDQLEALGIAVWVGPAASSFDDVYSQITELGDATGHADEAATVVADMKTRIEDDIAAVTASDLSVYHELDPTLYSLTSNTFAGQVYALFGLSNIADGAQEGNDYPQLNPEYIVQANPDLIFLADTKCCSESPETLAAREGWAGLGAVTSGNVFALDDDIASRWGPRILDLINTIVAAVNGIKPDPKGPQPVRPQRQNSGRGRPHRGTKWRRAGDQRPAYRSARQPTRFQH